MRTTSTLHLQKMLDKDERTSCGADQQCNMNHILSITPILPETPTLVAVFSFPVNRTSSSPNTTRKENFVPFFWMKKNDFLYLNVIHVMNDYTYWSCTVLLFWCWMINRNNSFMEAVGTFINSTYARCVAVSVSASASTFYCDFISSNLAWSRSISALSGVKQESIVMMLNVAAIFSFWETEHFKFWDRFAFNRKLSSWFDRNSKISQRSANLTTPERF